jgi:hypothetical protein
MELIFHLVTILISAVFSDSSSATALKPEIKAKLVKEFHMEKVLVSESCELDSKKGSSQALLIQVPAHHTSRLQAVIIHDGKVIKVPHALSYSKGSTPDFLADFWNKQKGFVGKFSIRCVVPGKDEEITTKANGEFQNGFKADERKHVCFQASNTYNDWACYAVKETGKDPELSFVQMNAD